MILTTIRKIDWNNFVFETELKEVRGAEMVETFI